MDESFPPVIDSSPLILLARVESLSLLKVLGPRVVVPRAVAREVQAKVGDPAAKALSTQDWLEIVDLPAPVPEFLAWELGAGETEVLSWAYRHAGTLAILDDSEARKNAQRLEIPTLGTLGLVLRAKLRGHLKAARPLIEKLLAQGMYLSPKVVNQSLMLVGE